MGKKTHIFLPLIFLEDSINSIHLLHTEGKKTILKLQLLDGAVQECGGWRGKFTGRQEEQT